MFKLVVRDGLADRLTDMVTYRAAISFKNLAWCFIWLSQKDCWGHTLNCMYHKDTMPHASAHRNKHTLKCKCTPNDYIVIICFIYRVPLTKVWLVISDFMALYLRFLATLRDVLAQAALRAGHCYYHRSLFLSPSFAFDPLWGNSRGWKFVSPNILA